MSRRFVTIPIDTMAKVGDAAHLPDGVTRQMKNVFFRPGPRVEKRAAWKTDMLGTLPTYASTSAFMKWYDKTSAVDRLLLDGNPNLQIKNATTDNWAVVGAITSGASDWTNYKDALYWVVDPSATPVRYKYDGTTLDSNPFRESLSAKSITAWKDRVWLFNVLDGITNQIGSSGLITPMYGDSGGTNITTKVVLSNGVTLTTWVPTSTTFAVSEIATGTYVVPASTEETFGVFRGDFLGLAPLYRMPMTLEVFVLQVAPRSAAVLVGTIRKPTVANGFRYRAVASAGNTGAADPAWNVVIGSDTVDGGVTWHNDGPDAFVSHEFEIENATDNEGLWQTEGVIVRFPPMPATLGIGLRWKYGTTARPTWELQPIGVGLRDGLADGTPGKKNFGQQYTVGRFEHDFVNTESTYFANIRYPNRINCTEAGLPHEIRADVFFDVVDGTGGLVVGRPLAEVMCAYKRNAISVYQVVEGTAAARLPMRYVGTFQGVGCIHPRAIATYENLHYFIGEKGVYVFDGSNNPTEITTDELREAIFNKDAGLWVEDVSLAPLLRVDEKNHELRIYTQRNKQWVYNLITKKWTSINITKDASGGESDVIDTMYYRDKFYAIATTNGLVREDTTGSQDDVYAAGVTSYNVTGEIQLHPYEAIPRHDTLIEEIELHHDITGDQTGSTLEVAVSFDRGATFLKQNTITIPVPNATEPIRIPLWQGGADMSIRLRHTGKTGPSYFKVYWAGMWVQDLGEELNNVVPVSTSVAL